LYRPPFSYNIKVVFHLRLRSPPGFLSPITEIKDFNHFLDCFRYRNSLGREGQTYGQGHADAGYDRQE